MITTSQLRDSMSALKATKFTIIGLLLLICHGVFAAVNVVVTQQGSDAFIHFSNQHALKPQIFTLHNPDRLVIDLKKTKQKPFIYSKTHTKLINHIRTGKQPHASYRIVLDLNAPLNKLHIDQALSTDQKELNIKLSTHAAAHRQRVIWQQAPLHLRPPSPLKPSITVTIDAGHGGKDPGATGYRGNHEKNIVLSIAKKVAAGLKKMPQYHIHLTRHDDHYLSLRQRLRLARKWHSNLFISIHADAFKNRRAHGASVFALSQRGATSEAARWLASKENASEKLGSIELDDKTTLLKSVLLDLSQTATVKESIDVGTKILGTLDDMTHLHKKRVEQAAFVVLKAPDIPSLLIETGFLSNRREEQLLTKSSYQQKIANAIIHGISAHFQKPPPIRHN